MIELEKCVAEVIRNDTKPWLKYFYWFEKDHLRTGNAELANEIKNILDTSGEFGPTLIVKNGDHYLISFVIFRLY